MPTESRTLTHNFTLVTNSRYGFSYKEDSNVRLPPKLIQYKNHLISIKDAIEQGDAETLQQCLITHIQCSHVSINNRRYWERPNENYSPYYVPDTYTLKTRPFIEWLFLEDRNQFYNFIQSILQPLNRNARENLCAAFVNSLNGTDLDHPQLWNLDRHTQENIREHIRKLNRHSKFLLSSDDDPQAKVRSQVIGSLTYAMINKLNIFLQKPFPTKNEETIPFEGLPDNDTEKLCILNFKLEFIKLLHSKDKRNQENRTLGLTEHRDGGFGIIISNLTSLLFTAGVANLILGIVTKGNRWYFFKQTDTQKILESLESNLGLRPS